MIDLAGGLDEVKVTAAAALEACEADRGASVGLMAVVREFDTKATKATKATGQAGGSGSARDAVIELEQAGDSAKAPRRPTPGSAIRPGRPCSTPTSPAAS